MQGRSFDETRITVLYSSHWLSAASAARLLASLPLFLSSSTNLDTFSRISLMQFLQYIPP